MAQEVGTVGGQGPCLDFMCMIDEGTRPGRLGEPSRGRAFGVRRARVRLTNDASRIT